jgi:hypothetical protein
VRRGEEVARAIDDSQGQRGKAGVMGGVNVSPGQAGVCDEGRTRQLKAATTRSQKRKREKCRGVKSALGSVQELVVVRGKQDWYIQDILNDEERRRERAKWKSK